MNLKLKAALISISVIASGLIAGYVMSFLPNWAVAVLVVSFFGYLLYTLSLAGLKYDQAIEEMNKKYEK